MIRTYIIKSIGYFGLGSFGILLCDILRCLSDVDAGQSNPFGRVHSLLEFGLGFIGFTGLLLSLLVASVHFSSAQCISLSLLDFVVDTSQLLLGLAGTAFHGLGDVCDRETEEG